MRVLAALSGGVDSAVAAARMVAAGHEVTAVHLALSRTRDALRAGTRGCCTIEDSRDAWRAADLLGIPFYVWDLSEEFARDVVSDFVSEYAAGRTPNPCLRCNEAIKFEAVLQRGLDLGYDAVCTGHYARLLPGPQGPELHRGVDQGKDQSYVLGVLDAGQLARCLFPLGGSLKSEVRREAADLGLGVAEKADSYDICFIPDGDTAGYLRQRLPAAPGPIRDAASGEVVGEHSGAYQFTIGQRRGLGLGRPAADGGRRYVTSVDLAERTVWVGSVAMTGVTGLDCDHVRWCGPARSGSFPAQVQVRAHGEQYPGTVWASPGTLEIGFTQPIPAVAPGQAAVLYSGTRVLGSGTVQRACRARA